MKLPVPKESQVQRAVIEWFAQAHKSLGVPDARLLMASANGGKRSIVTAVNLKRQGVRAGTPDLFLAVPRILATTEDVDFVTYGLFLELKRERGGVVSPEQREMHRLLREQGYAVNVAEGFENAVRLIAEYCRGK